MRTKKAVANAAASIFVQLLFFRSFFLLSSEIFLSGRQHKLDTVQLVDLTGSGVVIDGNDIRHGIFMAQLLDHAFSDNVVRQTAEGLDTDNVIDTTVDQLQHFSGKEPALSGLISERNKLVSHYCQIFDPRRRCKMLTVLQLTAGGLSEEL